jgi:hypothetical protein
MTRTLILIPRTPSWTIRTLIPIPRASQRRAPAHEVSNVGLLVQLNLLPTRQRRRPVRAQRAVRAAGACRVAFERATLPQVAVSQVPPPAIAGGYRRGQPPGGSGSDSGWIVRQRGFLPRACRMAPCRPRHVGNCPRRLAMAAASPHAPGAAGRTRPRTSRRPGSCRSQSPRETPNAPATWQTRAPIALTRAPTIAHTCMHTITPTIPHTRAEGCRVHTRARTHRKRADGVAERGPAPVKK